MKASGIFQRPFIVSVESLFLVEGLYHFKASSVFPAARDRAGPLASAVDVVEGRTQTRTR